MANRYYLLDISSVASTRLAVLQSRMQAIAARNCNAYHLRLSLDVPPSRALVQGDTTTAQHTVIMAQSFVLQPWPGDLNGTNKADPGVYAYLAANAALWAK